MSERGVFAVDRGVWDHPLFDNEEPLTKREAWLWLISEASWKPRKKYIGLDTLELGRGVLAHSIRFIAKAWGWPKSNVARFLDKLKTETMIEAKTVHGLTVINICKYDEYQRVSLPDRDKIGTETGTRLGQQRDKLEDTKTIETDSEAKASGAGAPVYTDSRHELWGEGVPILKSMGVNEKDARGNIGRWLKIMHDDAQAVLGAIQRARDHRVHGPIPWITNALKGPQNVNASSPNRANQATGAAPTRDAAILAGMGRELDRRRKARAATDPGRDEFREGGCSGLAGEPDAEPDAASGDGRSSRQLTLLAAGNG